MVITAWCIIHYTYGVMQWSKEHDDVIKWKHFPRYWPFVPVNSPHKGQWRGALMFTFICPRINDWVNNREAGDLRRHLDHYDVSVMTSWSSSRPPLNTSPPGATYMRQWPGSALVQIMAFGLFGATSSLNQCSVIVNWSLRNKIQWNFNQYTKFFIHKNASVNIVCKIYP